MMDDRELALECLRLASGGNVAAMEFPATTVKRADAYLKFVRGAVGVESGQKTDAAKKARIQAENAKIQERLAAQSGDIGPGGIIIFDTYHKPRYWGPERRGSGLRVGEPVE